MKDFFYYVIIIFLEAVQPNNTLSSYDIEDMKESVRQGVTKVAGKIGSLANGFMSSIQVGDVSIVPVLQIFCI